MPKEMDEIIGAIIALNLFIRFIVIVNRRADIATELFTQNKLI